MSALDNVVHAAPGETQDIELLRDRIDEIYHQKGRALLIGPDAGEEPVEVPGSAFEALRFVSRCDVKGSNDPFDAARELPDYPTGG